MHLFVFLIVAAIAEQAASRKRAAALAAPPDHTGGSSEVPPTLTPVTQGQVLGAIQQAWRNVTGEDAEWDGIVILAAQAAEETAGFAKLYGYNLGNITHSPGDGYDYNHRPEVPVASMVFRVYPDLESGATDLVEWAIRHGAQDAIQNGDLPSYMNALQAGCYLGCVGNETPTGTVTQGNYDQYQASIQAWMSRLENVAPETPPMPVGQAIGTGVAVLGIAAVGVMLWASLRRDALAKARKVDVHATPVPTPGTAPGAAPGAAAGPAAASAPTSEAVVRVVVQSAPPAQPPPSPTPTPDMARTLSQTPRLDDWDDDDGYDGVAGG